MKRLLIVFSLIFFVYGCAYPTSGVRALDDRPSIVLHGAPNGAVLRVDGLNMGQADNYDGLEKKFLLEPGTHRVEVLQNGTQILAETIFLGDRETKTLKVTLGGGAAQ